MFRECVERYPSTSLCPSVHSAHNRSSNNTYLTGVAGSGLPPRNPSFNSRTSKRLPPPLSHNTSYFHPERETSRGKLKNLNAENRHIPM